MTERAEPTAQNRSAYDVLCQTCKGLDIQGNFGMSALHTLMSIIPIWELALVRDQEHCYQCRLLLKTIKNCHDIDIDAVRLIWGRFQGSVEPTSDSWQPRRLHLYVDVASGDDKAVTMDTNRCIFINNVASAGSESRISQTRPIRPEYLDIELVKRWIACCEKTHAPCVTQNTETLMNIDFRVIDVFLGCLTKAPPQCEYVTLSYVWGGVEQVCVTSSLMEAFATPGSLWELLPRIPTTIVDAISLCQDLNQQYLWVDSLCIAAASEEKHRQILAMGDIYAAARFTIVDGASKDANGGLTGIRGKTRISVQEIEQSQQYTVVSALASIENVLSTSTWFTRGWTFQEYLLSKRLLIFTEHQTYFMCRSGQWREDFDLDVRGRSHDDIADVLFRQNWGVRISPASLQRSITVTTVDQQRVSIGNSPLIEALKQVYLPAVNDFLRRSLSRNEDILNAIAGILNSLSPALGESHFGLPEKVFHILIASEINPVPFTRRAGFPSWSWCGWLHSKNGRLTILHPQNNWGQIKASLIVYFGVNQDKNLLTFSGDTMPQTTKGVDFKLINHIKPDQTAIYHVLKTWGALRPFHIIFWTSSTSLLVDRQPLQTTTENLYRISGIGSGNLLVCVDPSWRETQPDFLEFIAVYVYDQGEGIRLFPMLVETREDISYRIAMIWKKVEGIKAEDWLASKPERRLVVLG